jgi:preprotein translocase subunit SecG
VRDFLMYVSVIVNILSLVGMVGGVLMHSGRGGGLSDMFGGAGTTALGSTAAERNLTRITTVFGIVWIGTVVALSFLLVR